jgi:hypothetical protein
MNDKAEFAIAPTVSGMQIKTERRALPGLTSTSSPRRLGFFLS